MLFSTSLVSSLFRDLLYLFRIYSFLNFVSLTFSSSSNRAPFNYSSSSLASMNSLPGSYIFLYYSFLSPFFFNIDCQACFFRGLMHVMWYILRPRDVSITNILPLTLNNVCGTSHDLDLVIYTNTGDPAGSSTRIAEVSISFAPEGSGSLNMTIGRECSFYSLRIERFMALER